MKEITLASKLPNRLLVLFLLATASPMRLYADDAREDGSRRYVERATTSFTDPTRPGRLIVRVPYSTMTITAHDSREIVAEAYLLDGPGPPPRRPELQRLDTIGLSLHERDNVVQLFPEANNQLLELVIKVPVETSLTLHGSNGGAITVYGVRGEIEIENSNAGIELVDVAGTVVASTSNGPITANLSQVDPGRPLSFITSNAPIDVTLPDDIAANVYIETDNGHIYTDFEIERRDRPEGRVKSRRRPQFRSIYGEIHGGGPEFRLRTDNSDVYLRRRK